MENGNELKLERGRKFLESIEETRRCVSTIYTFALKGYEKSNTIPESEKSSITKQIARLKSLTEWLEEGVEKA